MITSSASVLILMVLLLSIIVQGVPAFSTPTDDLERKIAEIDRRLEESESSAAESDLQQAASTGKSAEVEGLVPDGLSKDELVELREETSDLINAISLPFWNKPPAPAAREAGIGPALQGSIWVCFGCALFCLPLGIGTAIFLEEFKPTNRWLQRLSSLLQLNISNLAGVPSIVYGILGLTAFATMFGVFGSDADPWFEIGTTYKRQYLTEGMEVVFLPVDGRDSIPTLTDGMIAYKGDGSEVTLNVIGPDDDFPDDDATMAVSLLSDAEGGINAKQAWYSFRLPFGRSVLAASLTLMLVILPVIIISTQEALRAVPSSLRQAAQGLGCTPWQVISNVSLPAAVPGIMTGAILAMSRAIGEAAPILMLAGIVYITQGPKHLMDDFSVLPIQIYYWAGLPINPSDTLNFQHIAAGGIIVLLGILFAFNSIAVLIRQLATKRLT